MLSLGRILISNLVVTNLPMYSLPGMILLYLATPFLHWRWFWMRYHFCKDDYSIVTQIQNTNIEFSNEIIRSKYINLEYHWFLNADYVQCTKYQSVYHCECDVCITNLLVLDTLKLTPNRSKICIRTHSIKSVVSQGVAIWNYKNSVTTSTS